MAAPTAADFLAVQQLLRDKVGALRILFKEEGFRDSSPPIDVAHREIAARWIMRPNEKAALLELLRLSRPVGGRDVAELASFFQLLRLAKPSAMVRKNHQQQTPPLNPGLPLVLPRGAKAEDSQQLRELLEKQAEQTGGGSSVKFGAFFAAVTTIDASFDPQEARRIFASAAAAGDGSGAAAIEVLVRAALPHLSLSRQRVLSSDLVRRALDWDHCPRARAVAVMAAAEEAPITVSGKIPSASRTTRAQQLKCAVSQDVLTKLRMNDQWRVSPRQHRAPSPRAVPRPRLTPRRGTGSEDDQGAHRSCHARIPRPPSAK